MLKLKHRFAIKTGVGSTSFFTQVSFESRFANDLLLPVSRRSSGYASELLTVFRCCSLTDGISVIRTVWDGRMLARWSFVNFPYGELLACFLKLQFVKKTYLERIYLEKIMVLNVLQSEWKYDSDEQVFNVSLNVRNALGESLKYFFRTLKIEQFRLSYLIFWF